MAIITRVTTAVARRKPRSMRNSSRVIRRRARLRCSRLAAVVPAVEAFRGDAGHVEEPKGPHEEDSPESALSFPLPRRGRDGKPHGTLPPVALETPAQLHVFHQRHLRVAVHGLEDLATDEDGLVSRGDPAPPGAQVHEPGDHPEYGTRVVEAHIEAAADDPRILDRHFDCGKRPVGQPRVRVKEEEDLAPRGASTRVHLARASAGALEHTNAREARRPPPPPTPPPPPPHTTLAPR